MLKRVIAEMLEAIDPVQLIRRSSEADGGTLKVKGLELNLESFRRVHVLGAGKASAGMFRGLEPLLGARLHGGVVVSLAAHEFTHASVGFFAGDHPVPGERSEAAGELMLNYIRREVGEEDLVLFLLSGGASSLLVKPAAPLTLEDKTQVNRVLIRSGASIQDVNAVRKHLSAIKGGRLAEMIAPARLVTLVISDVVGSPLDVIGSGVTYGDSSTFRDALRIIGDYGLEEEVPPRVLAYLREGVNGATPDTPKPGSPKLGRADHVIIGENSTALEAAEAAAKKHGLMSVILTDSDQGPVREKAHEYGELIRRISSGRHSNHPPILLLSGGECTVKVTGGGRGGRNTEFILHLLNELKHFHSHEFEAVSIGTDGVDGPTDAAGAWITHKTINAVMEKELDIAAHLADNNAYAFFRELNQLIFTAPTHTNVMDVRLFYLK